MKKWFMYLFNGIVITSLSLSLLFSCKSSEEIVLQEPAAPQLQVPLADNGFKNIASNRALSDEEWAQLMGYVDISESAQLTEEDNQHLIQPDNSSVIKTEDELLFPAAESNEDLNLQQTIEPQTDDILYMEEVEATEENTIENPRIIDELPNKVEMVDKEPIADLGYSEEKAFLAGETQHQNPIDNSNDSIELGQGAVRIVDSKYSENTNDQMDPSVIEKMASNTVNKTGQLKITKFIRNHYSLLFVVSFGFLAILIFISMSKFAATGESSKLFELKKNKNQDTENKDEKKELITPLVSGKSFVFDNQMDKENPLVKADEEKEEKADEDDELTLSPADEEDPPYPA